MSKPRNPKNELKVEWSKKDNDFMVYYPNSADGHYIQHALFGKRLVTGFKNDNSDKTIIGHCTGLPNLLILEELGLKEELESRGYDITTLKFSIKRKREPVS